MAQEKAQEKVIEGEAKAVEKEAPQQEEAAASKVAEAKMSAAALKGAVESVGRAVTTALQDRGNVVMVRVNDDALRHMDMLVAAEVTKSRSESAAFLINEGITANSKLFDKVGDISDQITKLRSQLHEIIQK